MDLCSFAVLFAQVTAVQEGSDMGSRAGAVGIELSVAHTGSDMCGKNSMTLFP